MNRYILIILLLILSSVILTASESYLPGELIIQIRGDYLRQDVLEDNLRILERDFARYNLQVDRVLSRRLRIYLISFDPELTATAQQLIRLKQHALIEEAQFNHRVELRQTIPNDPLFSQQWALLNTGQSGGTPGADIDATLAWDVTTGGETANDREIVVAVIDDGFCLDHLDLDFWKNINEIPGNGIDDDGNGYIDDYDGWNAYSNTGNIPVASHGTHVSGIVGAMGNNGLGVSGVNWNVKVMPIAGSSSNESTVVAAYGYVHEMRSLYNETNGDLGAYIVATNSSFGVNYGQPENYPLWGAMYDAMGEEGIISAAATMNINANVDEVGDVPTSFPSPYLLGVTNTTRYDQKSNSAAYGPTTIDLGAPGTQILSTTPNNNYSNSSGTSMASPHVAGAIGLMYAAAPEALLNQYDNQPDELALIMKDLLLAGVDILSSLEGITVTGGRLNLNNAIQLLLDYQFDITPAPFNLEAVYGPEGVSLSWEVNPERLPQYFYIYRNGNFYDFLETTDYTYLDSNIQSGWTYEYYLEAQYIDPEGVSAPSNPAFVTIPPAAPLLILPENGAAEVELEPLLLWIEIYGTDFYTLEVGYDPGFEEYLFPPLTLEEPEYQMPQLDYEETFYWRVAASNSGGMGDWSQIFSFTTEQETSAGEEIHLFVTGFGRIYPNPFSPTGNQRNRTLQIDFSLEESGRVELAVYNIRGQLIANLVNGEIQAGSHTTLWNGKDRSGREVGNGIYLIRMESGGTRAVSRILLLK